MPELRRFLGIVITMFYRDHAPAHFHAFSRTSASPSNRMTTPNLHSMTALNNQTEFWNRVAWDKEFRLPINLALLRQWLPPDSPILDYGCGYGRVCQELVQAGFRDVMGVDPAVEMIRRGRERHPALSLDVLDPSGLGQLAGTFDAVLLIAVLTCIPEDGAQLDLMKTLSVLLRPRGLIYISDYCLQTDSRNRRRYEEHHPEFGSYGVFGLPEGAVVRHHSAEWIDTLTAEFGMLDLEYTQALTMNGHEARTFQYLGRKKG